MTPVEVLHSIIANIQMACGDKPEKLIVPYRLWFAAYKELNNIRSEFYKISGSKHFDRFEFNGVEIRIE